MKIYIIIAITFIATNFGYSQIQVQCPSCLPISACNQCFETQAEADNCTKQTKNTQLFEDFRIYPNPITQGVLNISDSKGIKGTILIINQLGIVVKKVKLNNESKYKIPLFLPAGFYYVKYIDNQKNQIINKKIIVKN